MEGEKFGGGTVDDWEDVASVHRVLFKGLLHRGDPDFEKDRGRGKIRALKEKEEYHVNIFEKLMLND